MPRSSSGQDTGFSTRQGGFDSLTGYCDPVVTATPKAAEPRDKANGPSGAFPVGNDGDTGSQNQKGPGAASPALSFLRPRSFPAGYQAPEGGTFLS